MRAKPGLKGWLDGGKAVEVGAKARYMSAPVNSAARKATGDPARREERRELEPVSCVDLR